MHLSCYYHPYNNCHPRHYLPPNRYDLIVFYQTPEYPTVTFQNTTHNRLQRLILLKYLLRCPKTFNTKSLLCTYLRNFHKTDIDLVTHFQSMDFGQCNAAISSANKVPESFSLMPCPSHSCTMDQIHDWQQPMGHAE